jgi:hypothetical protein
MNDQNNVIDLSDDDLSETPEQSAEREAQYVKNLTSRILLRTQSFLAAPGADDLGWLLDGLAKYMQAKGAEVARDKFVLLTWHTATCGECHVDADFAVEGTCVRYDEYVHGAQWMSPNFPVEQVKE